MATLQSANSNQTDKKTWRSPELEKIGSLQHIVQALNPGKSTIGDDGTGVGGGEEMDMPMM